MVFGRRGSGAVSCLAILMLRLFGPAYAISAFDAAPNKTTFFGRPPAFKARRLAAPAWQQSRKKTMSCPAYFCSECCAVFQMPSNFELVEIIGHSYRFCDRNSLLAGSDHKLAILDAAVAAVGDDKKLICDIAALVEKFINNRL